MSLHPSTGNSNLPNDPTEHTGDISDYIRLEEEVKKNKGTIHIKSLTSENETNPQDKWQFKDIVGPDGAQEAEKERLNPLGTHGDHKQDDPVT